MPDKRSHRGPHPKDVKLFSEKNIPALRSAVADYSMLLTKGYAEKSALKLVGDKFCLTERQRVAVARCSCSDEQLKGRKKRQASVEDASSKAVALDGYNVLITIEAALSRGFIFRGRDGCHKDLANIHGTYRKVAETAPAVELVGRFLAEAGINDVLWLLDSPVSNSGRLKVLIAEIADANGWCWQIELLTNPDVELMQTERIVASSDGVILEGCGRWINLTAEIIAGRLPMANLVDLSNE